MIATFEQFDIFSKSWIKLSYQVVAKHPLEDLSKLLISVNEIILWKRYDFSADVSTRTHARFPRKLVNTNPRLKVNRSINLTCIKMFPTAYVLCSLKFLNSKRKHKQKTSPKICKTETKILTNPALALSGFEQPFRLSSMLHWNRLPCTTETMTFETLKSNGYSNGFYKLNFAANAHLILLKCFHSYLSYFYRECIMMLFPLKHFLWVLFVSRILDNLPACTRPGLIEMKTLVV